MSSPLPYIVTGHFESAGSNVTLTWSAERNPDFIMLWNYTKFADNNENVFALWHNDYPAGDASIINNNTTNGMMGVEEATNGITANDSVAYSEVSSNVSASHTLNLTLGSALRGADSDEIYFLAIWANENNDLGDQA